MPYCKNCGNELAEDVNFCGDCGTSVSETETQNNQKPKRKGGARSSHQEGQGRGKLLLSLKPEFVPIVKVVPTLVPIVIFIGFFSLFFYIATSNSSEPLPNFVYIMFGVFALFWVVMPLAQVYFQKRTYEETEYKIFDDHVEYAEGFFSVQNNRVRLNRVVDVQMKQSIPQKWYNLGTITLDMAGGGSKNAVKFKDISEPRKIYEKVDELIARHAG